MALRIGAGDVEHIHDHAKEAYPEECAGAIVGMDTGDMKIVVDVWRAKNTHEEDRGRRFLIEPLQIKEFEERTQERDMDLLGFYHSHPDHPAQPSQYDLDHAWPTFAYIIVAVMNGIATDSTVWFLKDDRSSFEEGTLHGENPHSDTAQAVHR